MGKNKIQRTPGGEGMRPIHKSHPNGSPHPFKGATLCGKMVRFGGLEHDDRIATCKTCLKIFQTICPTCNGTGVKEKAALDEESKG